MHTATFTHCLSSRTVAAGVAVASSRCRLRTFAGIATPTGSDGALFSTGPTLRTVRRDVPCALHPRGPFIPSLVAQQAGLFTNAKKSFARGTEEELKARGEAELKTSQEFLRRPVDDDGRNAPRARDVETQLPSLKQLNEELPSAAELEKALKEGKMEAFAMKPEKDEE
ncbi:hypothetical protein ABB37_08932 [Leptomonas pyrrhocoris]|uniref:Uncharacterized protein n=1 Tax=Leptomonas pyrrhocoris TaxID=157538 RepID=A0A0N0DRT3_LEPPY|nr:hypothetical protein ABB37_08932 [Leptomonas pyrrhocoris]XP_015653404.1 hypothetical protein ABB37_08932 [Leptomonas pyrrhocoris]KPA74964.1 hypothetical protein ABB37_08932 [Leptomonas pyrrhocoris]KPA74965.1 hypothetical protein ABB37_08932 [Leptomonas pyrrhocoris]|eukprot:XP_015653403.1 hypothetical protein ABB37_08932 [Leptomonas pyrrhocoris]